VSKTEGSEARRDPSAIAQAELLEARRAKKVADQLPQSGCETCSERRASAPRLKPSLESTLSRYGTRSNWLF